MNAYLDTALRTSESVISICNIAGPLVTIQSDGTVVIHRPGADRQAAELFWGAVETFGKTRIRELEEENQRLRASQ